MKAFWLLLSPVPLGFGVGAPSVQARGLRHLVLPVVKGRGRESYRGSALAWGGLTFCLSPAPSVGGPLISDKWALGKIKGSSGLSSSGDLSALWFCLCGDRKGSSA